MGKKGGQKKGPTRNNATAAPAATQTGPTSTEDLVSQRKALEAEAAAARTAAEEAVFARYKEDLDAFDDIGEDSSDDEAAPVETENDDASDSAPDDWDAATSSEESEDQATMAERFAREKEAKLARQARRKELRDILAAMRKEQATEGNAASAAVLNREKRKAREEKGKAKQDEREAAEVDGESLRSPIAVFLGHVDVGKTKLLDRIRRTNVQGGEAGGITQQIGATFFPLDTLQKQTAALTKNPASIKVPGLLVIDTPGHASFTNLRSRGSSLCDMAILVVDLMHGLEDQTKESIRLLRERRTPFVVAVNKVDRCVDWKPVDGEPIREALKRQSRQCVQHFEKQMQNLIGEFAEQEINVALYWKNKDLRSFVSLVPTSAHTGEGIPDLLLLLIQLMQKMMGSKLVQRVGLNCTILEVKVIEGLGTTIDVVLVDGVLHEGDTIVLCGQKGPIITNIRALLTPQPGKELRVKGSYVHHKKLRGAIGIKISANDMEGAIAGSSLLVAPPNASADELEDLKEDVMADVQELLANVETSGRGVCVQASTLGSLEALLSFLKDSKIPVSSVAIGPVYRKDVMRASTSLERAAEYACILAFDVAVTPDAAREAESLGVRIFSAEIIYHLFDQFTAYMAEIREARRKANALIAVFPVTVKLIKCFNKSDPVIVGCEVVEGTLRLGTPMCVLHQKEVELGVVASIERDHKAIEVADKGDVVAVKIVPRNPKQAARTHGRHFQDNDLLASIITRESIDALKENFREELQQDAEMRMLIVKLKKVFKVEK